MISFAKYTHPTKVIFSEGYFKQKGATIVFNYILDHEEYFQNLRHLEISGHYLGLPPEEEDVMSRRLDDENAFVDAFSGILSFGKKLMEGVVATTEEEKLRYDLGGNKIEIFDPFPTSIYDQIQDCVEFGFDIHLDMNREPRASICYDNEGRHYSYYDVTHGEEIAQCGRLWSKDIGFGSVNVGTCAELSDLPYGVTEINIGVDICFEFGTVSIPSSVKSVVLRDFGTGGGWHGSSFSGNGVSSVFIDCKTCESMPTMTFPEVQQVYIGDGSFPKVKEVSFPFPKDVKLVVGKLAFTWCKKFLLYSMLVVSL